MQITADLPDDIDALKAMIKRQNDQIEHRNELIGQRDLLIDRKEDRIQRLEKMVADFRRALFGQRSEKSASGQYDLALEDIETAIAAIHAEDDSDQLADQPSGATKPKVRNANRGALPKHLPRVENMIEPDSSVCGCGHDLHVIGEDMSERLDIIPAQFRVIVTRRPKYACRSCSDGITQASAPARLIEGGIPTEATVAHVLVSKYADHLPLYRQAQIYSRQGVDLDRSTLAGWVGKAAFELRPVFDALIADLKRSTKLFMDETRAPVLDPGRGKTKNGYFWALARDDRPWNGQEAGSAASATGNNIRPPGVAFTYAPGRSGQHADDILSDFGGILQVDGYAGYNRLLKRTGQETNRPIQLAYCWAHARRKLYEVARNSTAPIAEDGLRRIAELYAIEAGIRGSTPAVRLAVRQAQSAPKITDFEHWLQQQRARVSAKSPLGEALKYIARFWDGLILFLDDGRIEMDSNAVERTIRPIALNRKNALFAGHDVGAQNWAVIASLIETCKLNAIEPHAWLTGTLEAIVNGHKQSQIDELLPWNYTATV